MQDFIFLYLKKHQKNAKNHNFFCNFSGFQSCTLEPNCAHVRTVKIMPMSDQRSAINLSHQQRCDKYHFWLSLVSSDFLFNFRECLSIVLLLTIIYTSWYAISKSPQFYENLVKCEFFMTLINKDEHQKWEIKKRSHIQA